MINTIQLRRQYLIGFLDGLKQTNTSDAYDVFNLEMIYKSRIDELDRLVENENTIDEGDSNT